MITSHICVSDTPDLQHKLVVLRAQYNEFSSNKALASINRLKQSFYDQGEKAGKLLAWRINALQGEKTINQIEKEPCNVTYHPKEINDTFRNFDSHLYNSVPPSDTRKNKLLKLNTIPLPIKRRKRTFGCSNSTN